MANIPKAWQELMDQQGISSIRELARIAGVTTSTGTPDHTRVNAVIMKGEDTSEENMRKVAAALKVPVEELYRIKSGVAATPISIPFGTEKLSERQKNAVTELIRTMIEEKEHAKEIVDKKSPQTAEPNQEKTASVTPIGGRRQRTPMERKFEETGSLVAKRKRDIAQDSPQISEVLPPTDE